LTGIVTVLIRGAMSDRSGTKITLMVGCLLSATIGALR
jgi:hypothetical protein